MQYNYHTHTYLCGHASGTPKEYVEKAIAGGIKYMGFSDHIPHRRKDGTESSYRVPFQKARAYAAEICSLREQYKRKIEIRMGFESEYYPAFFSEMVREAEAFGAEYLILGPHYLTEEEATHTIKETDSVDFLKAYVENLTITKTSINNRGEDGK